MRDYLKEKTFIRFPGGECYEILGMIGEGGSGLIYSAGKVVRQGENLCEGEQPALCPKRMLSHIQTV